MTSLTSRLATPALGQSFEPPSRRGALFAAVPAAVALLLAIVLLVRAVSTGISFAGFLLLLVAALLLAAGGLAAYWAWAILTLRYTLGGGVLAIQWGLTRHEAPVGVFQQVVRGRTYGNATVTGMEWPGCHVGRARVRKLGTVEMISLHSSPAQVLYLTGPQVSYGISVANSAAFMRVLQDQLDLTPALTEPRVVSHPLLRLLHWHDQPLQRLLALAAALAMLATGIVFSRYAGFPDQVILTFPDGDRLGDRSALLGIPLVAWSLLAGNTLAGITLAQRRRAAAYTLVGGLTFVEALLVVAALTAA